MLLEAYSKYIINNIINAEIALKDIYKTLFKLILNYK